MEGFDSGSEWRKWDLHFHTPSSYDYKNKSIGNNEIVEELKKNDISVVAITDHHVIDVDRILELQRIGREKNITVLPGIEFRAELGGSESIHYIGIFSEKLQQQELSDVWIKLQSSCKITKTDIENIGGDANIQCDFKETSKLIRDLGGIVTVHAGSKANTLEGITNSLPDKMAQKRELVKDFIDVFELGKEEDQTTYNEKVFPNLKFRLPMIICSDNHKVTDYVVKQNLWIKADPTFEGLKTITYEPEERVRIQNEMPESEKLDTLMIKEIRFESSDNKFTSDTIKLNKNLNVIIGGKSSGKSILLFEIAKTLYADVNHKVLKYLDTEDQKLKDLYDLSIDDSIFNFHIKLYSGTVQSLNDRNVQSSILPSIKYIPQNHLSNLVDKSRMNGATLKKLIRDLILEDESYKKKYDEFVEQAKKNDIKRNQDIDYYFSLKDEINKKKIEFSTRGDVKGLEEGIASSKSKIEQLNKKFSDEERVTYNSLIEKSSLLKIEEGKVNSDYQKIKDFNTDLNAVLTEYLSRKELMIESLEVEAIKNDFTEKYKSIENIIDKIELIKNEIIKDEEENFLSEGTFQMAILNIQNERNQVERDLKPFISKLENQKQVEAIQGNISEDEKKLSEIKQFQKEMDSLQHTLESQKDRIFTDFENNFKLYEKILYDLKPRITSIKDKDDKVEIIGSVKYHFPKIYKKLNDMRNNNNRFDNQSFEYLYPDNGFKSSLSTVDFDQILTSLKSIFENIESEKIVLKNNYSIKDACKAILTDYFFDHWDVKSDNDDIHKMSTGKASFVLLKLIIKLSKDNGPILIDQPEDNLDNRSVSNELVEYLKINKRNRQIILVTHNPNIVVNADSENIIVANQKGQNDIDSESPYQFDFINGSLENTFPNNGDKNLLKSMGIREHIADIVEGGMEAFRQRERKYSFKKE
ncbi:TrlF family AAA-like ATPase [Elizabethkingia anophelis]|uniref:TrlF family AAA-like ATPase n=1 Tax=Elizabethkingia anophelis TaxID=1117645 RepID=UPI0016278BD2|nr:hypothetical protein [Elizabethkingia anophelis]